MGKAGEKMQSLTFLFLRLRLALPQMVMQSGGLYEGCGL